MLNGQHFKFHIYNMITKSFWKVQDLLQCTVIRNREILPQLSLTFGVYTELKTVKGQAKKFLHH